MLSGTAEYALRAVVHLARHGDDTPMRASELAEAVAVPRTYLAKVLHELVKARVLTSARGKSGGFRLAVEPAELPLGRIVGPFDDIDPAPRRCLLGRIECDDTNPCPVHHRWKAVALEISRFFRETTLADVLSTGQPPSRRIYS